MSESVKVVSPRGMLNWVTISKGGKDNYRKDGKIYTASVVLGGKEAKAFKNKIDEVYENNTKKSFKCKSLGYHLCDKDGRQKDDDKNPLPKSALTHISFTFNTNVYYANGDKSVIQVYNSKAQKVDLGDKLIGNGSIGAIAGTAKYYEQNKEDGVSLFLKSIQLIKFIEYIDDGGYEVSDEDDEDNFLGITDGESGFTSQPEEDTANAGGAKQYL